MMPGQVLPSKNELVAARLSAAVALATHIQAEGFDELLDRFRDAYEVVAEVTDRRHDDEEAMRVYLPPVDAPEIPDTPRPGPPIFEREWEQ
jgi:hypothetical protein